MAHRDGGRDHGGGFRGNSGGGFNRGGFNRGPREMHDAVCCDCGTQTTVPFKPDPNKQVRCKDCYMKWKEQKEAA